MMDPAAIFLIVFCLVFIAYKLEQIERQGRRETKRPMTVDEEMKELNPDGISK